MTRSLDGRLSAIPELEHVLTSVDPADQPHALATHVAARIAAALRSERNDVARLELANELLAKLPEARDDVLTPVRELQGLHAPLGPGVTPRGRLRPRTPLKDAALLTATHGEPTLASELRAELDSADRVDLLCAFVMWRGVRLLEKELSALKDAGVPFRVITTTYIGGTEREALDRLVRDYGAEVRVQYDAARTRLHAKAWLFHRESGLHTAYVGSSNLSTSALLDGVEWNVRLSQGATPSLLAKFRATFDAYWNGTEFESYNPERDRDRLDDALIDARGRRSGDGVTVSLSGLDVRPYPYQLQMLERLEAERQVHDRHRNLLVAATGTGKTVVAALDYRAMCVEGARPRLLFVAHRKEILDQSLRTYREVLGDANFGSTFYGGQRPERWSHVFASVQSLTAYGVENIPADSYDVVVIDEFHHAEARTYRRLLEHLRPQELLGLTATPERADGTDVRSFFGGRTAAELRLWDALGADLLCPFHYFAVADGTDLRQVSWSRGRYDESGLSSLYTGNDARARIVLTQVRDKVGDVGAMRALGFCVSVAHADYMARVFKEAGIPALAVNGSTSSRDRERALDDLRSRRVNVLFAADLFNEGLDLPDVDTVLFLRPTESSTVFLQQLGRGLRRTPDKAVLTVLDFVGFHRAEFRFVDRFRALTGATRTGVARDVDKGFPFLPSGCQIVLDEQSRSLVLENLKAQIGNRWTWIVAELRSLGDVRLHEFLTDSGVELSDVLRKGTRSWTQLRRDADLPTPTGGDLEEYVLRRVRALSHVDDARRAEAYSRLLNDPPEESAGSTMERRLRQMLTYSLWRDGGGFANQDRALRALAPEKAARSELATVVNYSFSNAQHRGITLADHLADVPLTVHARYQIEEVLGALDFPRSPSSFREGVVQLRELKVDVFFVTLKKSEADYSPTTMYADYPISPTLFHWESQSTTSVTSPTGLRYLNGSSTVLLFARHEAKDEYGTSPYTFLGPVTYVSHHGSRPIAITWALTHAMPADFYAEAAPVAL